MCLNHVKNLNLNPSPDWPHCYDELDRTIRMNRILCTVLNTLYKRLNRRLIN